MIVHVNGQEREVPEGATVAGALDLIAPDRPARGIAVAVNGEVVPRATWADAVLASGARVEIVTAIQGG